MNAPLNHPDVEQAGRQEFLLASARAACANLRTWTYEIEMICVALKGGMIELDHAVAALDDIGVLAYLPEPTVQPERPA